MFFFKQLLLVFPGRVALGKLGMWMVRVGEALQRCYAGWNKTFRLKVEQYGVQCMAIFHVSEKVTDQWRLSFDSPDAQLNKQPSYVKQLFDLNGVTTVYLSPYSIQVNWGKVFSAEEIIPKVEKVLIEAFTK